MTTMLERLALTVGVALLLLLFFLAHGFARDNGQYADSSLKAWFDSLASKKGLCCSFSDGVALQDPEWGTHDDHYWVILNGVRYAVPPEAVLDVPNKAGVAVVWPYERDGEVKIRCFIGASGT